MAQRYMGLLSGTSMDAIDAALVELEPFRLLATHTLPMPAALRQHLFTLIERRTISLEDLGALDIRLGRLFAETALGLLAKAQISVAKVQAIGSHGQTIYHWAHAPNPFTLQLGDPNTIAEMTGITTVADFRRRDLAAGGQGAPLAPAFHAAFLSTSHHHRAVLNIGGMANISFLPIDSEKRVWGFDTGPGNALIDGWILRHLNKPLDQDGCWAASGQVNKALLQYLLADPFFSLSPPKSTGREYFNMAWLDHRLDKMGAELPPADVQATLCALTATSIKLAIQNFNSRTEELLVCGGGANNKTLMEELQKLLAPCHVTTTATYGIPSQWVEACTFAWLAKQTLEGHPGNLPEVTGARHPVILGAIYPGNAAANSRA
ncbi:anhydro-N-acetylmuramic acid kinase [Nitrosococcus wardiae]|uniref:Anhydro-N-acetylmuramic acid kinase n=1 Tax=Nitrosococcus wardiae TaxID=1814290 RepID=A0A4P7C5J6_9GAMM|nr:anhydro-N-acetylmuramic acid kinase [Nitrosococcus wardiae]QBQ56132.1 anhydro-N-acetylmuramic acid kinase [Nitrosococcus wardiae]